MRLIVFQGFADAELGCAPLARAVIVTLKDDHVAAVPAAALEIAAAGRSLADRRDHLEELVTDWQDRVLEPEGLYAGIPVGDLEPEHFAKVIDDRGNELLVVKSLRDATA